MSARNATTIRSTHGDYAVIAKNGPCGFSCCQTKLEIVRKVPAVDAILEGNEKAVAIDGTLYVPTDGKKHSRHSEDEVQATAKKRNAKDKREAAKARKEAQKAQAPAELQAYLAEIGVVEERVVVTETVHAFR